MERIAAVDEIPTEGLRFDYRDGPFDEEGILLKVPDGEVRAAVTIFIKRQPTAGFSGSRRFFVSSIRSKCAFFCWGIVNGDSFIGINEADKAWTGRDRTGWIGSRRWQPLIEIQ